MVEYILHHGLLYFHSTPLICLFSLVVEIKGEGERLCIEKLFIICTVIKDALNWSLSTVICVCMI